MSEEKASSDTFTDLHKETVEALRQSEEKYRNLFDHSNDGIVIHDLEGKIIDANQRALDQFGYIKSELMSLSIPDLHPPEALEASKTAFEAISQDGFVRFEIDFKKKCGELFPAEVSSSLFEIGGKPVIQGIVRDITRRKQTQEALRESQEGFLTVLDSIEARIYVADLETYQILFINRQMRDDFGDDTIGEPCWKIFHNESRPCTVCPVDKLLDADGNPTGVYTWEGQNPLSSKYYINYDRAIKWADGRLARLQVGINITERVRMEKALRDSEERYRQLVEHAPAGIYEIDFVSNKLVSVNDVMCEYTGYTREEFLSLSPQDLLTQESVDLFLRRREQTLAGVPVPETVEYKTKGKNGQEFWVMLNTRLEYDAGGMPTRATVVAHNITERKRLEEQLRQAQKMEAVGRLAGGVAHDFNNLLTSISGFAELMRLQLRPDDPLQELLEKILGSGQRAADLIRQLLAFSRRQIIQPKVLDLNRVVAEMDGMLQRIIGDDTHMETILAPDLWSVRIDPAQIEQVIVNLAINARDAMPNGGRLVIETANVVLDQTIAPYTDFTPSVEAAAEHPETRPGEYVLLSVRDTGTGMSQEVKTHLFEPFFTTKEVGEGSGLGLSTVYGVVKQNHGEIQVDSEEGQGTRFKIYLPRALERATFKAHPDYVDDLPRGTETVLLVEDEPMVRELAAYVLRRQGYMVIEAANGEEALNLAKKHGTAIDLLLTDVVMPRMSGKELADRLEVLYPSIHMLFSSGYTDEAIDRHGVLLSDVDFIQKPFSPATLARRVRDVLNHPET